MFKLLNALSTDLSLATMPLSLPPCRSAAHLLERVFIISLAGVPGTHSFLAAAKFSLTY